METILPYSERSEEELRAELEILRGRYRSYVQKGYHLDMSRGKPGKSQLAINRGMLTAIGDIDECYSVSGTDCRNYGLLDGIPEAKAIFADILDIPADNIIVCGNSSLNIMYDTVARAMLYGIGGNEPWSKLPEVRFLCPVPGYDRHFSICESFGIKMIPVPMREDGPDMEIVADYVNRDPAVKGIWCVPKYSNPDGITYSDEVVRAFAALEPAAPDFRIFWDNAYPVHDLYLPGDRLLNLYRLLSECGKENMAYFFSSTSKITFPGSGIAMIASGAENVAEIKRIMSVQTIGFDKMNMLRHVRFFGDADGVREHMKQHASLIRPKFEIVLNELQRQLGSLGVAHWSRPRGGYFISLYMEEGSAKRVFTLCRECGVTMTTAGATYPYGQDPHDSNLRIAPTYPEVEELAIAVEVFCCCVRIADLEKRLFQLEA